jgi:polyvinyl alcohol dehydrogenase (cytochrome)
VGGPVAAAGRGTVAGTGSAAASGGVSGPTVSPTGGTGAAGTGAPPPPAAGGNSWPMMGYDANNNYFNPNETKLSVATAPMLKEKWRFTVSGYPPGTPIVAEGKVFAMSTGGMYGINLADGKMAWSRTDIVGTASAAYENGFVYVHTFEGPNLYKLKAADGMTVWGPIVSNMNTACDGMSSPIVAGGMVVVGHSCGVLETGGGDAATARGGVEAFDTETGMRKWSYFTVPETGENGAMVWSSVSIDPAAKVVYAATGNNYSVQGENSDSIHAIDMTTGMRKWKQQVHKDDTWSLLLAPTGPDTDFGANPILAVVDGKKVIGNGDKGSFFHMFDRETGQVLWSRDKLSTARNQQNGGILMNGAFDGKYFYAVANQPPGQAVLHVMDPSKMGADVWTKNYMKLTWGAPSLANGVLVVPSDDALLILNAATGDQLAMFTTGGTIAAGSAAIVDGNVVVKSGLEYALDSSVKSNNQIICYGLP